jgi:hypothetical protein
MTFASDLDKRDFPIGNYLGDKQDYFFKKKRATKMLRIQNIVRKNNFMGKSIRDKEQVQRTVTTNWDKL